MYHLFVYNTSNQVCHRDRGFKSDHLIHSTHRFHVIIALLFNNMLVHGYTPDDLLKSSIISIPKDNTASLKSSDNYRGIPLFNIICKLFDNVILLLYGNELQSSDMQFGFKQGHSTTLCSLIYKEVVNHYLNCCSRTIAGVTMTLFCTHGRVSGPSSLLDLEVMAPRGYSVPCQF